MNMEQFSTEALHSMEHFPHVSAFVLDVSFLTTLPLHATLDAVAPPPPASSPPLSMFCDGSWHLAQPIQSTAHSPRHVAYVCKHAAHRLVLLRGTFAGKGDGAAPDGHQLVLSGEHGSGRVRWGSVRGAPRLMARPAAFVGSRTSACTERLGLSAKTWPANRKSARAFAVADVAGTRTLRTRCRSSTEAVAAICYQEFRVDHIPSGARILPFPACHSCH